ncbi:MYBPH protein, partial [Polypterus senegalus]|nr:MYBPH protein [Polypterus senegalus]
MPAKPAPIKKAPAKKAAPKAAEKPAAPAEKAPAPEPAPEEPAAPPPPPPEPEKPKEEPTSEPVSVSVEDVNDTSLTVKWRPPETVGPSGVDGYIVEYCKDGTQDWISANQDLIVSNRFAIKGLTTGEKLHVRVKAVNPAGPSKPGALEQPVLIREIVDRPKIRLPRNLRTVFVKSVGETLNLVIPFQGKPKPQVTWTKNGQPLDTKQVGVRNSDKDTILFIRKCERKDSGKYEATVKIDTLEDKATIDIQIVEKPGSPQGIKLVDVWGFNVALEWTPPKDDGNSEITGYTVQKSDKKTGEWFTVLEHYHRLNCTISDLIMGNSYFFRVFAENRCGLSEQAAVTKSPAQIQKTGIDYKPPEYKDHNFSEAPKFTQALQDRSATIGYSTKLLCAVRGNPKPRIVWMKNQMEIRDDPKFMQISSQGVCTLEIRKPCPFDGGVYTCKAINVHGEAAVNCKLDVKGMKIDRTSGSIARVLLQLRVTNPQHPAAPFTFPHIHSGLRSMNSELTIPALQFPPLLWAFVWRLKSQNVTWLIAPSSGGKQSCHGKAVKHVSTMKNHNDQGKKKYQLYHSKSSYGADLSLELGKSKSPQESTEDTQIPGPAINRMKILK